MQVLELPSCDFSTELDAGFARRGAGVDATRSGGWPWGAYCFLRVSDLVDGEMADDRHVGCSVAFAQPGLVFVEDDVEHPVQLVFDPPRAADGRGGGLGREPRRGDIIAGLETAAVLQLSLACDPDDRGDVGQAQFAGETPLAAEPVDLARDRDGTSLDSAMTLVDVDDTGMEGRLGVLEEPFDLVAQGRLVGLDGQKIVGADLTHRLCDGAAAGDRVDGHDRVLEAAANRSSSAGMAVNSLDLPATASCPSARRLAVANAETTCRGALSWPRSWLRREVLPSMVTSSGRSGQQALTQLVKQAENNAGLIRFIMIVSQRPLGMP